MKVTEIFTKNKKKFAVLEIDPRTTYTKPIDAVLTVDVVKEEKDGTHSVERKTGKISDLFKDDIKAL